MPRGRRFSGTILAQGEVEGDAMGFWHTGYIEFHEPTGDRPKFVRPAPSFDCRSCGAKFASDQDLRVHQFEGHATPRPLLIFQGRECGRGRLHVTRDTSPGDWVFENARHVTINDRAVSPGDAPLELSGYRAGVVDVRVDSAAVSQVYQFEFARAEDEDLEGVDLALERLIDSRELSTRAIDDFIMRAKPFGSASRYTSGLSNYLYGVLVREGLTESNTTGAEAHQAYQSRYDAAVNILGSFDRRPAEAICGMVAFHYNQFGRALTKTNSPRVAAAALRLQAMLAAGEWVRDDLSGAAHSSLDVALSDSVIDDVLRWVAVSLTGGAGDTVLEFASDIRSQRPQDALKLRLVAAEHFLAVGDAENALAHAEAIRQSTATERWYTDFRARIEGA